ncbi:MAG: hypothetical protein AAGD40_08555, partial [Pseudomonadota bacterium]
MTKFGWAAIGLVAIAGLLALYMISYRVDGERDRVADLAAQIEADEGAIARLEAELGVRASLTRLEDINARVWNLGAPTPEQIVGGPVQLAAMLVPDVRQPADAPVVQHAILTEHDDEVVPPAIQLVAAAPEVPQPLQAAEPEAVIDIAPATPRAPDVDTAPLILAAAEPAAPADLYPPA